MEDFAGSTSKRRSKARRFRDCSTSERTCKESSSGCDCHPTTFCLRPAIGQKIDETRAVTVEFPTDFLVKELAGKQAIYTVTLREIKQRVLPSIDDEFAAKMLPGKKLEDLRHMIEHDLEHEKEHEVERVREGQIVQYLHDQVQLELPPSLLRTETRRALGELVQRNRERGITDEMLKDKEKELVEGAAGLAAHRLKTNFILSRIAETRRLRCRAKSLISGSGRRQRATMFRSKKCAANSRNTTG